MCQMSIILEKDGEEEIILTNAAKLEVLAEGIKISALFEEPKILAGTAIKEIDFLDGKVWLKQL